MSRKRLTLTDKVKIIEESLTPNFSPEKTGKQYGIHRTTVVKLLKKKDSILQPSKISRVVQNWGQLEGFPNYPGGMESLLKIENSIMLKRLQYKNKLLTFASECRWNTIAILVYTNPVYIVKYKTSNSHNPWIVTLLLLTKKCDYSRLHCTLYMHCIYAAPYL